MLMTTLRRMLGGWGNGSARRRRVHARQGLERLEDRTLLSNLTLNAAGQLIFGGGAEVNNVVITFDGTNYRFEDLTGTVINPAGLIVGMDTDPAPNVVVINAGLVTINQIVFNGNAGDDIVTLNSIRQGDGFDVRDVAGDGNDTVNVNTNIGVPGTPTLTNVLLRGENINLNGSILMAPPTDVRLQGNVNLISDVTITATAVTQSVISPATIQGPGGLTVNSHNMEFQANLGGITPLGHFHATGNKLIVNNVSVTGDMSITTNNLVLTPPLTTWAGGNTFSIAPLTAASPLVNMTLPQDAIAVTGFQNLSFGNAITQSITVASPINVPGFISMTAATVTVNARITTGGAKNITANTVNLNTNLLGGSPLNITALVGANPLVVNGQIGGRTWDAHNVNVFQGTGGVTFSRAFGSNVINGVVNGPGNITFTSNEAVNSQANIALNGALITLPAGIQTVNGGITINGNVSLTGPGTFRVGAGNNFSLSGGMNANGNNVSIRGVGGAINSVTITNNVTNAGLFSIDSTGAATALNVNVAGITANNILIRALSILLNGGLTSAGNVSLLGPTTLGASIGIVAGGVGTNVIEFSGPIESAPGNHSLNLNNGNARVILGGTIGAVTPLTNLSVVAGAGNAINHNITLLGAFSYINNGLLTNNATIIAPGGHTIVATPFNNKGTLI
jgi:hypothetical protein